MSLQFVGDDSVYFPDRDAIKIAAISGDIVIDCYVSRSALAAKGLEWTTVFVLNAVDGCIPSDLDTGSTAEIEEERRLMYVAMTRAKDELHIMQPRRFFTHNQPATPPFRSRSSWLKTGEKSASMKTRTRSGFAGHHSLTRGCTKASSLWSMVIRLETNQSSSQTGSTSIPVQSIAEG